jgi:hypothetical protein
MPLIAMVSPSTIKAVPDMSALAALLNRERKMKVRSLICISHW